MSVVYQYVLEILNFISKWNNGDYFLTNMQHTITNMSSQNHHCQNGLMNSSVNNTVEPLKKDIGTNTGNSDEFLCLKCSSHVSINSCNGMNYSYPHIQMATMLHPNNYPQPEIIRQNGAQPTNHHSVPDFQFIPVNMPPMGMGYPYAMYPSYCTPTMFVPPPFYYNSQFTLPQYVPYTGMNQFKHAKSTGTSMHVKGQTDMTVVKSSPSLKLHQHQSDILRRESGSSSTTTCGGCKSKKSSKMNMTLDPEVENKASTTSKIFQPNKEICADVEPQLQPAEHLLDYIESPTHTDAKPTPVPSPRTKLFPHSAPIPIGELSSSKSEESIPSDNNDEPYLNSTCPEMSDDSQDLKHLKSNRSHNKSEEISKNGQRHAKFNNTGTETNQQHYPKPFNFPNPPMFIANQELFEPVRNMQGSFQPGEPVNCEVFEFLDNPTVIYERENEFEKEDNAHQIIKIPGNQVDQTHSSTAVRDCYFPNAIQSIEQTSRSYDHTRHMEPRGIIKTKSAKNSCLYDNRYDQMPDNLAEIQLYNEVPMQWANNVEEEIPHMFCARDSSRRNHISAPRWGQHSSTNQF